MWDNPSLVLGTNVDILPPWWSILSVPSNMMTKVVGEHAAHPSSAVFCQPTAGPVKVTPVGHSDWKVCVSVCARTCVSVCFKYFLHRRLFFFLFFFCTQRVKVCILLLERKELICCLATSPTATEWENERWGAKRRVGEKNEFFLGGGHQQVDERWTSAYQRSEGTLAEERSWLRPCAALVLKTNG